MCIIQELTETKAKIFEKVKLAAQKGDIDGISFWSKAAEKCHKIISETEELENRVRDFIDSIRYERVTFSEEQINVTTNGRKLISAKQEGAQYRKELVGALSAKGIILTGHGKSYHTEFNSSLGIAFANEIDKPQLVDKWFLGLRDEPVDFAILLCRDKGENLHDFIIPFSKMGSTWKKLSRSGGQIKFHVQRQRGGFVLQVPGDGPLNISQYKANYLMLRGQPHIQQDRSHY
jgi:hypothetical protein